MNLKSSTLMLVLAFVFTVSPSFPMKINELRGESSSNVSDLTDRISLYFAPDATDSRNYSALTRSALFDDKEWIDIEIGYAILQDRIKQKETIYKYLNNDDISLRDKMMCCQNEFGAIPCVNSNPQEGVETYSKYILMLLDTYKSAGKIARLFTISEIKEEKNKHQNNLYYILSHEKKYFEEFVRSFCAHQIPEQALEDNFYEIITSKMCASATKDYAVLSEYIKFSMTTYGAERQIRNKEILEHYRSIHEELIKNFQSTHPVFWLGTINLNIKKVADAKIENIKLSLDQCGEDMLKTTSDLSEKISSYKESSLNPDENIIYLYNAFGPLILNTIKNYEAISEKIKEIENDSIEWLKSFKENKKLFRSLSLPQRQVITDYLKGQEKIALTAKREAERATTVIRDQNRLQKKPEREEQPLRKKVTPDYSESRVLTSVPSSPIFCGSIASPMASSSQDVAPDWTALSKREEAETQPNLSNVAEVAKKVDKEPLPFPDQFKTSPPSGSISQPKVKVKTRPNPPATEVVIDDALGKADKEPLPLPEQFNTHEFKDFIKDLLGEKNDKKLIASFKKLNLIYGIPSETYEKNNKGYFSIQSPVTNQIHARTYHHFHGKENHYASIFMAIRDVLIDANIIER